MLRSGSARLIMPKKTRKEKIKATTRRTFIPSQQTTSIASPSQESPLYSFTQSTDKKIQQKVNEYSAELVTIKSDLYKTIFFAIIAFGVEIYLYTILK